MQAINHSHADIKTAIQAKLDQVLNAMDYALGSIPAKYRKETHKKELLASIEDAYDGVDDAGVNMLTLDSHLIYLLSPAEIAKYSFGTSDNEILVKIDANSSLVIVGI